MTTNITAIIEKLASKRISQVNRKNNPIAEAEAYIQSLLYRCLDLIHGSISNSQDGHLISAMSVAKSLSETVAITVCFEKDLADCIIKRDIKAINKLLINYCRAHSKHNADLVTQCLSVPHIDPKAAEATQILERMRTCTKLGHKEIQDTYDWLCEHDHPNALGTYDFFTRVDIERDIIMIGLRDETITEAHGWVGEALKLLPIFERTYERLEQKVLPDLKELLSKAVA